MSVTIEDLEDLEELRQRMKRAIESLSELEHCAGIREEYGPGEVARLQAERHGVGIAMGHLTEFIQDAIDRGAA